MPAVFLADLGGPSHEAPTWALRPCTRGLEGPGKDGFQPSSIFGHVIEPTVAGSHCSDVDLNFEWRHTVFLVDLVDPPHEAPTQTLKIVYPQSRRARER